MFVRYIVGLALGFLQSLCFAQATEPFPWVQMTGQDIRFTAKSSIEAGLRSAEIRKAMQTIDVVIYDQRTDEVGREVLDALRSAANRGVHVRFIRGSRVPKDFDERNLFRDRVQDYLTQPPTRRPIEYILVGNMTMLLRGWSPLIGTHEKMIVIDHRLVFASGRGHGSSYQNWLDTCFVFKGPLVQQAQAAYQSLWNTVFQATRIFSTSSSTNTSLETVAEPTLEAENPDTHPKLIRLKQWAAEPSQSEGRSFPTEAESAESTPTVMSPAGSEPLEARVIHNNLIEQANNHCRTPWLYGLTRCTRKLVDPTNSVLLEVIGEAREFKMNTLATSFDPQIKAALLARLQESKKEKGRPFTLTVFTNSKSAHQVVIRYPMAWYTSLPDLYDLIQAGATVYTLRETEKNPTPYLHRKLILAITFNGDHHVIFGSHNCSWASSKINDEVSYQIKTQVFQPRSFAWRVNELFEESVHLSGAPLQLEDVQQEYLRHQTPFLGWHGWGWQWASRLSSALL